MRDNIKIQLLKNLLKEVTKEYDHFIETQNKVLKETFQKSIKDPLTKLYNREYLKEIFFKIKKKSDGFALIFIDVNNFKGVNDNYGHDEGDKVLVEIAHILTKFFRKDDIIVRYGGDEFVILMEITDVRNIRKILKHIESRIIDIFNKYNISIAYGVATSEEATNLDSLIELADKRMYHDKISKKLDTC